MSIEINWETLTSGEDGDRLAESIRAFIHDRFQKVTLPKFIRSVKVHSFDFGTIAPDIEIKDVCDPLPDFYEDDEEGSAQGDNPVGTAGPSTDDRGTDLPKLDTKAGPQPDPRDSQRPIRPALNVHQSGVRSRQSYEGTMTPLSPGIPGGTTNFSYFHMPLNPGLSGMHMGNVTPHFANNWPLMNQSSSSIANQPGYMRGGLSQEDALPEESDFDGQESNTAEPAANDVQIVSHLRYSGNVRLSLTADILLDYPTTSFVGIPLLLNVTGMTFDGVAIVAYIKRKAHFCFLGPDDADALVGGDESGLDESDEEVSGSSPVPSPARNRPDALPRTATAESAVPRKPVGGLFEEIHVESEIGQKSGGKQVLKNVGKVEKFVLEQVRKIFENEFVYPSFWTFLV